MKLIQFGFAAQEGKEKRKSTWKGEAPEAIIDDKGINFFNDVEHLAEYGEGECKCFGFHPLEENTWYHCVEEIPFPKIVRKCRNCHHILVRRKIISDKEKKRSSSCS